MPQSSSCRYAHSPATATSPRRHHPRRQPGRRFLVAERIDRNRCISGRSRRRRDGCGQHPSVPTQAVDQRGSHHQRRRVAASSPDTPGTRSGPSNVVTRLGTHIAQASTPAAVNTSDSFDATRDAARRRGGDHDRVVQWCPCREDRRDPVGAVHQPGAGRRRGEGAPRPDERGLPGQDHNRFVHLAPFVVTSVMIPRRGDRVPSGGRNVSPIGGVHQTRASGRDTREPQRQFRELGAGIGDRDLGHE